MTLLLRPEDRSSVACANRLLVLLNQAGETAAEQEIHQAIEQFISAPVSLAVLGRVKRGKSTLINALLGRSDDLVAPIDRLPASSAISRFRWNESETATIYFRDGRKESIPFSRIREFATEEGNPENTRGVESLEIRSPFPRMEKELEIVDTPGAGSIHEHHDALVHAYIPHADAVIFLVSARMPIDQEELDLLRALKTQDIQKVFFAMNRVDEASEKDLADAETHNSKLLSGAGIPIGKLHRISAKLAFQGNWDQSGVAALLLEISEFLGAQKHQLLESRLCQRVRRAVEPIAARLEAEVALSKKSSTELGQEKEKLSVERSRLTRRRDSAAHDFRHHWNRALLEFEQALRTAEAKTQSAIQAELSQTSLTQVGQLAKQLPTTVQSAIDRSLANPTRQLESELQAATDKLQASYPSLGEFFAQLRPVHSDEVGTVAKGLAATALAVTAGSSLVAAGSATAASISAANLAAATAAASTVAAPSAITGLVSGIPYVGSVLASLTTGTATVGAPVAFTTTPLWVALSGPVGWTLVGIGVFAVPFAWRVSKLRTKQQLETAARDQIAFVFSQLHDERLSHLRKLADSVVKEFELRLDRQLEDLEETLDALMNRPADASQILEKEKLAMELRTELRNLSQAG